MSTLQEIAETLATDFTGAVKDAEEADIETIDKAIADLNSAYEQYSDREATLNTQAENALKTLQEISDLRDVNATTFLRRVKALRDGLAEFKASKMAVPSDDPKVVKLKAVE